CPNPQIKASQKSSHDSCSGALVVYQRETVCPEHLRQTIQKLLDDNENTNVKKIATIWIGPIPRNSSACMRTKDYICGNFVSGSFITRSTGPACVAVRLIISGPRNREKMGRHRGRPSQVNGH